MNQQNADPRLAELAAEYAKAAQEAYAGDVDDTDPNSGFRFRADGRTIVVFRVEPIPFAEPTNDWYEWRILDAAGATVAKSDPVDPDVYSESAMREAWLQFTRLIRTNETDESDIEAEALYRAARDAVRAA